MTNVSIKDDFRLVEELTCNMLYTDCVRVAGPACLPIACARLHSACCVLSVHAEKDVLDPATVVYSHLLVFVRTLNYASTPA